MNKKNYTATIIIAFICSMLMSVTAFAGPKFNDIYVASGPGYEADINSASAAIEEDPSEAGEHSESDSSESEAAHEEASGVETSAMGVHEENAGLEEEAHAEEPGFTSCADTEQGMETVSEEKVSLPDEEDSEISETADQSAVPSAAEEQTDEEVPVEETPAEEAVTAEEGLSCGPDMPEMNDEAAATTSIEPAEHTSEAESVSNTAPHDLATAYNADEAKYLEMVTDAIYSDEFAENHEITLKNVDIVKFNNILSRTPDYIRFTRSLADTAVIDYLTYYIIGNDVKFVMEDNIDERVSCIREQNDLEDWIRRRTGGLEPTLDNVKMLYNEIAQNTVYDRSQLKLHANTVITEGVGVCGGFARVFDAELKNMGVESYHVLGRLRGDKNLHAWNAFVIDGHTYSCDLTYAVEHKDNVWKYFKEDPTMLASDGVHLIESVW